MRDDRWLETRLDQIWSLLFSDIERKNKVIIRFKGRWKNKFGHIKLLKDKSTEIAINKLFSYENIPEYIIDLTIAHELVHYAHGFNSPLPQLYKHPHRGGIVTKELRRRGFGIMLEKEKHFVKERWFRIYQNLASLDKDT